MNTTKNGRRNGTSMSDKEHSGSALIVAIGMVVLMAMMGLVLVQVSGASRRTSAAWADNVQARMLAQSGLEKVINMELTGSDSRYRGEDWNGNGTLDSVPASYNGQSEDYNGNNDGDLDTNCSPKYALHPSFFVDRDNNGNPDLFPVKDRNGNIRYRGYSGELPSSYGGGKDVYSIRVVDNSTKINVNSLNENISSVLDNLYHSLPGADSTKNPGTDAIVGPPSDPNNYPEEVMASADRRDSLVYKNTHRDTLRVEMDTRKITGGYGDLEGVKENLESQYGKNTGEDIFEMLEPFLVVHHNTYVDWSVAHPNPQEMTAKGRPKIITNGNQDELVWIDDNGNINGNSTYPYDYSYRIEPRAPVNVNRAQKPVLKALVQGLKARVQSMKSTAIWSFNPQYDWIEIGPILEGEADKIADELINYQNGNVNITYRGSNTTGPFKGWQEFEAFVDQRIIDSGGIFGGKSEIRRQRIGYLIKANFNPNTRLSKFNGNSNARWGWFEKNNAAWVRIDKTDFLQNTTEFIFFGGGYFEVESYGQIISRDDEVQAEAHLNAVVKKYDIAKHSTQRDFILNKSSSSNLITHPENIKNVDSNEVKNDSSLEITGEKVNVGSDVGGKIAVEPQENVGSSYHHYWKFSDPDRLDAESRNSSVRAYPLRSKEYNDVSADTTSENYGLAGGSFDDSELNSNYPMTSSEDPSNFSDITPDGLLMSSDRYRGLTYSTEDVPYGFPQNSWKHGKVEFWWKPRQEVWDKDNPDNKYNKLLLDQYFLTEQKEMRTPYYKDAYIRSSYMTWYDTPDTHWEQRVFPDYLNNLTGDNIGDAAGYHMHLHYHGAKKASKYTNYKQRRAKVEVGDPYHRGAWRGWRFRIDFLAAFDENGGATWGNQPRTDMYGEEPDLVPQKIYAELPIDNSSPDKRVVPRPGKWMHVVAKWEVKTITRDYFGGSIYREPTQIKVIMPELWINGVKSKRPWVYCGNWLLLDGTYYYTLPMVQFSNWYGEWMWVYREFQLEEYGNWGWIGNKFQKTTRDRWPHNVTYWDNFADGTVDEIYMSNNPDTANAGDGAGGGNARDRYPTYGTFTGRINRADPAIWDTNLTKYNNYAKVDQRVFLTDKSYPIKIMKIGHSQYRPLEDCHGNDLPASEQPYFALQFRPEGGSWVAASGAGNWQGEVKSPQDLFGKELEIPKNSSYLEYQISVQNMVQDPQNITPYFEDLILLYRRKHSIGDIKDMQFIYSED